MPVLKVYGLPGNFNGHGCLSELKRLLAKTTADNIPNLPASQVTVFLVSDMDPDVGKECAVFVDGLFANEERTPAIRQKLAQELCAVLSRFLTNRQSSGRRVECFVRPFNPCDGFSAGEVWYSVLG